MSARLSVILERVPGRLDAAPRPVTQELVVHMNERGQSEVKGVWSAHPDHTLLDIEAGDVLVAFRKQYEVASVREFPPGSKGGLRVGARVLSGVWLPTGPPCLKLITSRVIRWAGTAMTNPEHVEVEEKGGKRATH
jgi:hypothetical protein